MGQAAKLTTSRVVAIAVLFQVGWLISVIGAAQGYPWLGVVIVPLIGGAEVYFGHQTERNSLIKVAVVLAIGLVADSMLLLSGVLVFPSQTAPDGWPSFLLPPFLMALWVIFPLSVKPIYGWLKGRLLWQIVFGAFGGAGSYLAGEKLGALQFNMSPWITFAILAVVWAVLFPSFMALIHQDKYPRRG